MGYEIYVEHPESQHRRAKDFAAWSLWAPENAPWTGVGISDMAALVQTICGAPGASEANACTALDEGGMLQPPEVTAVWRQANKVMNEKVREVFHRAMADNYPIRVVFSKGFGSMSALAYLAKQLSS